MTIRPVDISGMIQRTDDVGVLKHQEDVKPLVDQQNIQTQMLKHEDEILHQVNDPKQKGELENHADAKEEGKGLFYKKKDKKKKSGQNQSADKVVEKNRSGSIDIKI